MEEAVVSLVDNWGLFGGSISAGIMFYRMNIGMGQEFSDKEEIVKDPLGFAVKKTATFNEFQADSWKASDALFAAIQFRTFYQRFRLLVDPLYSKICVLIMFAVTILLIVEMQIAAATPDPKINNLIGGAVALIVALWWAIVDHGKALKKSVEKLRIK